MTFLNRNGTMFFIENLGVFNVNNITLNNHLDSQTSEIKNDLNISLNTIVLNEMNFHELTLKCQSNFCFISRHGSDGLSLRIVNYDKNIINRNEIILMIVNLFCNF